MMVCRIEKIKRLCSNQTLNSRGVLNGMLRSMQLSEIVSKILYFPRWLKKTIVVLVDAALCVLSAWLAFCLRFDDIIPVSVPVALSGIASALLCVPIFIRLGLYRAIFRFSGWHATLALVKATSIYMVLYAIPFCLLVFRGCPDQLG